MRGFTLIEMVMVIAITGIVGVSMVSGMAPLVNGFIYARIITKADTVNRIALKRISLELNDANAVATSSFPSSSIEFTMENTGDVISYSLNGTDLMRQKNGGTARLVSEDVTTLQFESDGIYYQTYIAVSSADLELRTRVYPRNI